MTCNQTTYELKVYRNMTLHHVILAAYRAVDQFIIPQYNYDRFNKSRRINYVMKVWETGPDCIYRKDRFFPLVIARAMVVYYLRFYMNYGVKAAANVFGQDHTTAVHSTKQINNYLKMKHDNSVKDAIKMFLNSNQ